MGLQFKGTEGYNRKESGSLEEILRPLSGLREFSRESLVHVFDILLVAYLNYRLLSLTRGSRAWRILGGIVAFVLLLVVSSFLKLQTLNWILDKATLLAPVALVILLLPELRQALEGVGKLGFWPKRLAAMESNTDPKTIDAIVQAAAELASASVGALVVIEREASLDEIISNGVRLDAQVSAPLLGTIFYSQNPLHDGAAVVRGNSLVAAACRLPLSESPGLDRTLHMRHRAAVGVTEQNDCVSVVVSEERGTISVAMEGTLKVVSLAELRNVLNRELRGESDGRSNGRTRPFRMRTRKEEALEEPVV